MGFILTQACMLNVFARLACLLAACMLPCDGMRGHTFLSLLFSFFNHLQRNLHVALPALANRVQPCLVHLALCIRLASPVAEGRLHGGGVHPMCTHTWNGHPT